MKQSLDSKTIAMILGGFVVLVVIAAFAYFKPQIGEGPPVEVVPYKRPGSEGYGPGAASGGAGAGAPVGTSGAASQTGTTSGEEGVPSAGGAGMPMGAPRTSTSG